MDQQTNATGMSSLPPEMIEKIFELLTHRERLTASLTCKEWHQFAFSPMFCKKLCIRIDDNRESHLPSLRDIRTYQKFRHAYVKLASTTKEIPHEIVDFIKTAPLELLEIHCNLSSIKMILDDHLLCMNALTKLIINIMKRSYAYEILRINHPNLKYVTVADETNNQRFEINCPNLIDLKLEVNYDINYHLVTQLQHQLQCLELTCITKQHFEELASAELSNLKKLWLKCGKLHLYYGLGYGPRVELSFDRMVNLVELQLSSSSSNDTTVGEQLGVMMRLSKLTLSKITIDAKGFANALLKMVKLRDLELTECKFSESCHIASEHVENLTMNFKSKDYSMLLPHFPQLKGLSNANYFDKDIDNTFAQICDIYPKLEKLRFEVGFELGFEFNKFQSSTSFSNIKKLKFLKDLHLVDLGLKNIDWMECSDMKVVNLHLEGCWVDENVTQQLVASIGPGLRRLFLHRCTFDMSKASIQDLPNKLPWCNVSLKDCSIMETHRSGSFSCTTIQAYKAESNNACNIC